MFTKVALRPCTGSWINTGSENQNGNDMRILVVEDEKKMGDYLRQGLTENGYVVDLARDGVDGQHLALTGDYDLILLDVMLPGIDGWSVMRELRRADKTMPVLFLTARDKVEDRVKGLELGADDYLIKPFAFSELLARAVRNRTGIALSARRNSCMICQPSIPGSMTSRRMRS